MPNERERLKFISGLETEPPVDCEYALGDFVDYENDYGVVFEKHQVIGFSKDPKHGRYIHLDLDCYWSPTSPANLSLCDRTQIDEILTKRWQLRYGTA